MYYERNIFIMNSGPLKYIKIKATGEIIEIPLEIVEKIPLIDNIRKNVEEGNVIDLGMYPPIVIKELCWVLTGVILKVPSPDIDWKKTFEYFLVDPKHIPDQYFSSKTSKTRTQTEIDLKNYLKKMVQKRERRIEVFVPKGMELNEVVGIATELIRTLKYKIEYDMTKEKTNRNITSISRGRFFIIGTWDE